MSDEPMLCALPGCMTLIEQPESGGPRRLYCSAAHRATARKQRSIARLDPEPIQLGADPVPDPELVPDGPKVFSPTATWVIRPQPLPPRRARSRRLGRAAGDAWSATPARRRAVASIAITSMLLAGGSGYTLLDTPGSPPVQAEPPVVLDPPPDAEQWATRAQVVLTSLDRHLFEVADVEDKWKRDPRSRTTTPPAVKALTERKVLLTQQRATVQSQLDALRSLPKVAVDVKAAQAQLDQIERAVDAADTDGSSPARAATRHQLESQREMRRRQRDQNVAELTGLRDSVETAIATPLPDADSDDVEPVVDDVRRLVSHDPSPEPPRIGRHSVPDVIAPKRHSSSSKSERQDVDTSGSPHPSVDRSSDDGDGGNPSTRARPDGGTSLDGGFTDRRASANDRDHDLAVQTLRNWTATASSSDDSSRTERAEDPTAAVHEGDDAGRQDGDRRESSDDVGDLAAGSNDGSPGDGGSEGSGDEEGGGSARDGRPSHDDNRSSDDADALVHVSDRSSDDNGDALARDHDGASNDRDELSHGRDGSSEDGDGAERSPQGDDAGPDREPWYGDPLDPRLPASGRPAPGPRDPGRPDGRWGTPPSTGPVEPGYPLPTANPGTDSSAADGSTRGRHAGETPPAASGSDDAHRPGTPHPGQTVTPTDGVARAGRHAAAGEESGPGSDAVPAHRAVGSAPDDRQAAAPANPTGGQGPDRKPAAGAGRHAAADTGDDTATPATRTGATATNASGRHSASEHRAAGDDADKPGTDKPGTDKGTAGAADAVSRAAGSGKADTDRSGRAASAAAHRAEVASSTVHPDRGASATDNAGRKHAATTAPAEEHTAKAHTVTEQPAKEQPAKRGSGKDTEPSAKSPAARNATGATHTPQSDTGKDAGHAAKAAEAKTEPGKNHSGKSNSDKIDSGRSRSGDGPSKSDSVRSPGKGDASKTGSQTDASKSDSGRSHGETGSGKSNPSKDDSGRSDSDKSHSKDVSSKSDPSKSHSKDDSSKSDPSKSHSHKSDSSKDDSSKSHSKDDSSKTKDDSSKSHSGKDDSDKSRSKSDSDKSHSDKSHSKSDSGKDDSSKSHSKSGSGSKS